MKPRYPISSFYQVRCCLKAMTPPQPKKSGTKEYLSLGAPYPSLTNDRQNCPAKSNKIWPIQIRVVSFTITSEPSALLKMFFF